MSRIVPLWQSPDIRLHRFDHPVEHEDQPYVETASAYQASFVEDGRFNLEVGERRWRVGPGDVLLQHPGMRFSAGFEGKDFNDTCLTLTYAGAAADRFDAALDWARRETPVFKSSNRLRYLRWGLHRAIERRSSMFVEYCATEIFQEASPDCQTPLYTERKFSWYAERVHHVRERIENEFAEELSASELARSTGMSMFHFSRVFSEMVGMPPHRYLLKTRLDAARNMLLAGRTVTDTCFAAGFGNLSHFSRSYARRFGVRPSQTA